MMYLDSGVLAASEIQVLVSFHIILLLANRTLTNDKSFFIFGKHVMLMYDKTSAA